MLSYSRDQARLEEFARELGPKANTGTPAEAVAFGDVILISVPWSVLPDALDQAKSLAGKIVLDTTNQFGAPPLPARGETAAHFNAARMPGARYTKSFNTLTSAFQAEAAGDRGMSASCSGCVGTTRRRNRSSPASSRMLASSRSTSAVLGNARSWRRPDERMPSTARSIGPPMPSPSLRLFATGAQSHRLLGTAPPRADATPDPRCACSVRSGFVAVGVLPRQVSSCDKLSIPGDAETDEVALTAIPQLRQGASSSSRARPRPERLPLPFASRAPCTRSLTGHHPRHLEIRRQGARLIYMKGVRSMKRSGAREDVSRAIAVVGGMIRPVARTLETVAAELVAELVERPEALCNLPSVVRKEQSMERADISRWLDDYVLAWKTYDRDAIGALFSDDVSYRYHPYDEPVRGREAVVSSWLGEGEEDGASASDDPGTYDAGYLPVAVNGDVAVATGRSTYYAGADGPVREVYDNCFVMRFDSDGRCREFTEWYMKRPPSESQP